MVVYRQISANEFPRALICNQCSLRTKNFIISSSKQTGADTATTSFHSSNVRGAMLTSLPRNVYLATHEAARWVD